MSKIKTAVILGAGASAAEGAPIQATLFREFFKSRRSTTGTGIHEWDQELEAFFQDFFGINVATDDLDKVSFPTFEEILGMLELAESQHESFRGWPRSHLNNGASRILRIHDILVFMIGEILADKLHNPPGLHRQLLANLRDRGDGETTSFLSFNYDILVDNALLDTLGEGHTDYGVGFVNQPQPQTTDPLRMILLKLHGSLNWLHCPTCRDTAITPHKKGVMDIKWDYRRTICKVCGSPRSPIVIPPTFFKVMANLALRNIWDYAERVFYEAKKLVFCGYSFPDADVHVRYMLKRAELHRARTPEVFVVNDHPGKSPEAKAWEKERYLRFFVDKSKVHYTNVSFEAFARDPSVIQNKKLWL